MRLTIKTIKIRILQLQNCSWLLRLFYCSNLFFAAKECTGLPQGQEKSGNQEKSGKIKKITNVMKGQVKIGVFEKSQVILQKLKKHQIFQFKFTKFFIFQSRQIVTN